VGSIDAMIVVKQRVSSCDTAYVFFPRFFACVVCIVFLTCNSTPPYVSFLHF
jgi:ABC-type transporter Mla maintaining outer membrane lipid asymmetry permease subunit MlaE